MGPGTAAAFTSDTRPLARREHGERAGIYGGLVGQMIDDIDARMTVRDSFPDPAAAAEDFLHTVSVACGYVGLIAGFAAAAGLLLHAF
jgi:hypothetical protein